MDNYDLEHDYIYIYIYYNLMRDIIQTDLCDTSFGGQFWKFLDVETTAEVLIVSMAEGPVVEPDETASSYKSLFATCHGRSSMQSRDIKGDY